MESFANVGNTINNSFFFVVDIIISIQGFFIREAKNMGQIVFLIALLSAALNYALTGQGLKENLIKITKATLFFLIVIFAYPTIISHISTWAFNLAKNSVYRPVYNYFNETIDTVSMGHSFVFSGTPNDEDRSYSRVEILKNISRDKNNLLGGMTTERNTKGMKHTVVAPASLIKILFFLAEECFNFADDTSEKWKFLPDFSRILKGLICAFFIIFTGIFALLEYIVCFLEFMLVAAVGIILFPFSLWEGSKFIAESFIKALLGFFIKLMLCNLAIFLLIYGFISLFHIMNENGFTGAVDQIIFIIFFCLMFFFICKSAPALAASLLTGTPSLSATAAISAAAGAVGAVAAAGKIAGGAASTVMNKSKQAAGALVGGGIDTIGGMKEAGSAAGAVKDAGGTRGQQAGAFFSSIGSDIGDKFKSVGSSLTRSLLGGNGANGGGMGGGVGVSGINPHSWMQDLKNRNNTDGTRQTLGQHFNSRKDEGSQRGQSYAQKKGLIQPSSSS